MAGTTNQLVAWARDIGPMHDAREYDTIVATGEQVTVGLLAIALQNLVLTRGPGLAGRSHCTPTRFTAQPASKASIQV